MCVSSRSTDAPATALVKHADLECRVAACCAGFHADAWERAARAGRGGQDIRREMPQSAELTGHAEPEQPILLAGDERRPTLRERNDVERKGRLNHAEHRAEVQSARIVWIEWIIIIDPEFGLSAA